MEDTIPVTLYVYDLSRGMAKALSKQLTGKQIDGIWHTSIVVYGIEYYFGQGIFRSKPGTTHHGEPVEKLDLGMTSLPKEFLEDYLQGVSSRYGPEHYNLMEHNCNTFSNEISQLLTGNAIPEHITGLPADFLATPFGQSIAPMLGASCPDPAVGSSSAPAPTLAAAAAASSASLSPPPPLRSAPTPPKTLLHTITSEYQVEPLLRENRASILYFTSQGCPPCRIIHPEFETLIRDQSPPLGTEPIIGLILDLSVQGVHAAAAPYSIRGTPTFVFLLDGKEVHRFSGANVRELRSHFDLLLSMAYPPHHHLTLRLPALLSLSRKPILFSSAATPPASIGKKALELSAASLEDGDEQAISTVVFALETPLTPTLDKATLDRFISLLARLDPSTIFPALDLLRLLLLSSNQRPLLWRGPDGGKGLWEDLLTRIDPTSSPRPAILLLLRCLCNLFASSTDPALSLLLAHPDGLRDPLSQFLISSLLAEDKGVREAASSLAFNIANYIRSTQASATDGTSSPVADVDWKVELVSAAVTALEAEPAPGPIYRLVGMLGRLIYEAEEEVIELAQVLGLAGILGEKRLVEGLGRPEKELIDDVGKLIA